MQDRATRWLIRPLSCGPASLSGLSMDAPKLCSRPAGLLSPSPVRCPLSPRWTLEMTFPCHKYFLPLLPVLTWVPSDNHQVAMGKSILLDSLALAESLIALAPPHWRHPWHCNQFLTCGIVNPMRLLVTRGQGLHIFYSPSQPSSLAKCLAIEDAQLLLWGLMNDTGPLE